MSGCDRPLPSSYLLVSLEHGPQRGDLLPLGAEQRLQLQHLLHQGLGVALALPAVAERRAGQGAALATQVHRHLGERGASRPSAGPIAGTKPLNYIHLLFVLFNA